MVRTEKDYEFEKKVSRTILSSMQTPAIGEAGKTGEWRSVRPILHAEQCIVVKSGKPTCHLCWLYCPEITVTKTIPPLFDLDYCKGCGICAEECPTKCIEMVPEKDAPSCVGNEGGEF